MKKILIATSLLINVIFSCVQKETNDIIYWTESNAICVHWTDFGKKNFDTKAVRIELKSKDPKVFDSSKFYLHTDALKEKKIRLGRIEKIKQDNGEYFLYLFIESKRLYEFFPKGENFYGDDCYHIELANMLGQGKVIMQKGGNQVVIGKSENYIITVGPT